MLDSTWMFSKKCGHKQPEESVKVKMPECLSLKAYFVNVFVSALKKKKKKLKKNTSFFF